MTRRHALLLPLVCLASALLLVAPAAALNGAAPSLTVTEDTYGSWVFEGLDTPAVVLQVPSGALLLFSWQGDASAYGGTVDGYRYGWDLSDPSDPNDPGWAVVGYVSDLLSAAPTSFGAGTHALTVEVRDTAGTVTRATVMIEIQAGVPVEPRTWGSIKAAMMR